MNKILKRINHKATWNWRKKFGGRNRYVNKYALIDWQNVWNRTIWEMHVNAVLKGSIDEANELLEHLDTKDRT